MGAAMRFRFIGQYTHGRTSIRLCGVEFIGNEPTLVTDADALRRLTNHPEFEQVADIPAESDVVAPVSQPKRRGRKARHGQF